MGVDLVVRAHATRCAQCREILEALELRGGTRAAGVQESRPLLPGAWDKLAALLDETPEPAPADDILPGVIRHYTGPFATLSWRRLVAEVMEVRLPLSVNGVPVRLMKAPGDFTMAHHRHTKTERSLVLMGACGDEYGEYARGDMITLEPDTAHALQTVAGADCVLLAVAEGYGDTGNWLFNLFGRWKGI